MTIALMAEWFAFGDIFGAKCDALLPAPPWIAVKCPGCGSITNISFAEAGIMRKFFVLALFTLVAAGCTQQVCSDRGKPPSLPFPHALIASR